MPAFSGQSRNVFGIAYLHGIAQLEAIKVFGTERPDKIFAFGLDAWLVAASAGSLKKS